MVNWIYGIYIGLVILLIVIFAYGYFTVDWEAILSGTCEFPEMVCTGLETLGFPSAWLTYRNLIWRCIIPLFGITAIFYGFLSKVGIFSQGINIILSFVVSLSTVPIGIFVVFVAVLFSVVGIYSVILFFAMIFLVFSMIFTRVGMRATAGVFKEMDEQIRKIHKSKDYYGKEIIESKKEINDINKKMKARKIAADVGASMILQEERRIKEAEQMQTTADEKIKQIKDQKKDIQEDIKKTET
jgi:hypothetical protein